MFYKLEDTICAQSTPNGRGGIHVLRISGPDSLNIVSHCFLPFQNPASVKSRTVYYGHFCNPDNKALLDEVLVTYFKKGASFTGEDTVEISTHGNPVIVKLILEVLTQLGCRLAEKGEFSYRAYKNGRITAAQAEALLSVIESNSNSTISKALDLLQGDISSIFKSIESDLIWMISRLEAKIDFSTEDIEVVNLGDLVMKLNQVIEALKRGLQSFKTGLLIDKGCKTIILGSPNVGKSSLFNYLIGSDRSIVSSIAGTTRDYVSEQINIYGRKFELIDTAGIRYSRDDIETQGILKINKLIDMSNLVIILLSPDQTDLSFLNAINPNWRAKKVIFAYNKSDLMDISFKENTIQQIYSSMSLPTDLLPLKLSVKNQTGIDELKHQMSLIFDTNLEQDSLGIVSLRQAEELEHVLQELFEASSILSKDDGDELVLFHLNKSLKSLLNVFHIQDDEIIRDRIFKDFCLGK